MSLLHFAGEGFFGQSATHRHDLFLDIGLKPPRFVDDAIFDAPAVFVLALFVWANDLDLVVEIEIKIDQKVVTALAAVELLADSGHVGLGVGEGVEALEFLGELNAFDTDRYVHAVFEGLFALGTFDDDPSFSILVD